ncbi:MAG: TonB-dependent receptor, partial [Chitinophagaceae bacterium]|nr:TonB-dependent receptor [Chitinophagaceae bacterium]
TKNNLSKKEIEKLNLGQDIPFLLNQLPSVVINSDAGNGIGYTGLRIRGSDLSRINVTLNGIPYNDAESQGVFFVDLPDFASSVNSIQVQRGVGTSSNGAGAFGATINMGTNEFNEKAYAELNNSYGSFNTWRNTIKAGTGLLNKHFTVDARLSNVSSDGYIDRATSDLKSFYLSTAYFNDKSSLRFNIFSGKEKTYQAWYGVPENLLKTNRTFNSAGTEKAGAPYDNETDNYRQDHYQLFYNQQISDRLTFNTALFLTRGLGYYEQYKAEESYNSYGLPDVVIGSTTIDETDLIRQLWLDNYYYGNIFSLQYKNKQTQWVLGGGWNRYDGNHYGKIIWSQYSIPKDHKWYDLDAKKTDFNIYAKLQREFNKHWAVFADLQYRRVSYGLEGFRNNPALAVNNRYNFFNPKAGIRYSRNNLFAYLSYAIANKEPNRDDFEAGQNQQPLHETLHDVELGIEKRNYNWSYGATLFYMRYKNQLVLTGKVNDVGAYTRTNIPNSYRAGIELQGRYRIEEWVNVSGNIALSKNKVKNFTEFFDDYDNGGQKTNTYGTTDISFSPDVVGSAAVNFIPFKNAELSFISKYVSRQYLDNTSQESRSLNPYYLHDVRMIYNIKTRLLKEVNMVLQVNNLFNKKYEPNGYTFSYIYGGDFITENYYYPMAGRNFMLGVNIKIN